jgi:hypothetical protein
MVAAQDIAPIITATIYITTGLAWFFNKCETVEASKGLLEQSS